MLSLIKNAVYGLPTLFLIFFSGLYFDHKCGIFKIDFIKKLALCLKNSFKKDKNGISPFAALSTALGGTVGVGSIVGVTYGIKLGGVGSVFWSLVCSVVCVGLKYAEIAVSLKNRVTAFGVNYGGAPYRLKEKGKPLAAFAFCLFCVLASFLTGNLAQTGALALIFSRFGVKPLFVAAVLSLLAALSVFGGAKRITSISAFIIPAFSAVYIFSCLAFLFLNIKNLPFAMQRIFLDAFNIKAVFGGGASFVFIKTMREGFARSVFSGEAGMGSSPLAHSASSGDAETQATLGVFELLFDAFVSLITALCVVAGDITDSEEIFTFLFGTFGKYLFALLLFAFAFASVIAWCRYGEACVVFAFKSRKAVFIYRLTFALSSFLCVFAKQISFLDLADIINALMMIPNMYLLFLCGSEIYKKR